MSEDEWYAERRRRWRPERVRLLLVAESAPHDNGVIADRRFFYDGDLTGRDSLFREVVRTMDGNPPLKSGPGAKSPWLARLQQDGVFLIDLAPVPVNKYTVGERTQVLASEIAATTQRAKSLAPAGVVLVKQNVFELLHMPFQDAGLNLLHNHFIPFPGSGQQARFREQFAAALENLPS